MIKEEVCTRFPKIQIQLTVTKGKGAREEMLPSGFVRIGVRIFFAVEFSEFPAEGGEGNCGGYGEEKMQPAAEGVDVFYGDVLEGGAFVGMHFEDGGVNDWHAVGFKERAEEDVGGEYCNETSGGNGYPESADRFAHDGCIGIDSA